MYDVIAILTILNIAIPDFQKIMLPLLQYASDTEEHSLRQAIEALADKFNLNEEERKELLPSGQQAVFDNRVGWTKTHLKKARLLENPKRGYFKITERGKTVLSKNPSLIDTQFLEQFSEYLEFKTTKKSTSNGSQIIDQLEGSPNNLSTLDNTPQESIEQGYQQLRKEIEIEILSRVKACSPDFFERLVVD